MPMMPNRMQYAAPTRWKYVNFKVVAHLCYYIAGNRDLLSQKIIDFKDGLPATVTTWVNWAKKEIEKTDWCDFDYIIRSLGSAETCVSGSANRPLDVLGINLALASPKAKYVPEIICKTKPTRPLHTILTASERRTELEAAYKLTDKSPDLNGKKILIIDDVTTAGTTFDVIANIIKAKYPRATLYAFCLGQTQRTGSNQHIQHPF
jgi:hypothetical protein